mgnify:CR=1 FL=1
MAEGKGGIAMYVRLQIAYALEFAIWGCWSYALGAYCGDKGIAQGSLYAAFAFGALFAPIVGPIADKKFAAQKVLAFMQLICGLALFACYKIAHEVAAQGATEPGMLWWALMFVAGLMFMPTIPLLNAIVFKHIPNDKKSPFVFIFGTLGWIAVNLFIGRLGDAGIENFYIINGIVAVVFAFYALTLPNTPPSGAKTGDPLGLKALSLFKRPDFAIFITCATLVGIFGSNFYFPLFGEFFYADKGVYNQYSEIIFMAALAFAVAKIGLKWTLTLGLGAWGIRYLLFAQLNDTCALIGIFCHGLAYAFLYTAAYMYGDKVAPKEMKASVQALIAFLLLGVAQILSGYAVDWQKTRHPGTEANQASAAVTTETASFSLAAPAFAQDEDIDLLVEEPVAEDVAVDDVFADEPIIEEPVAEEPIVEEPIIEEPVAEEPVAEEPIIEEPVAEEPIVEEPVVEEPIAEEPVVEEPIIEEPVVEEPIIEEPVVEEPIAEEPIAEEPVVEEPVAGEPVAAETPAAPAAKPKFWECINQKNINKYDWKSLWTEVGVFCLIFAVIFAVLGREPKAADEEA